MFTLLPSDSRMVENIEEEVAMSIFEKKVAVQVEVRPRVTFVLVSFSSSV